MYKTSCRLVVVLLSSVGSFFCISSVLFQGELAHLSQQPRELQPRVHAITNAHVAETDLLQGTAVSPTINNKGSLEARHCTVRSVISSATSASG